MWKSLLPKIEKEKEKKMGKQQKKKPEVNS